MAVSSVLQTIIGNSVHSMITWHKNTLIFPAIVLTFLALE